MIIIYKEFKDDKAEFTKEELEKLLEQARKEGYDEGYAKGCSDGKVYTLPPITYPTSPTIPNSPTYPYITWGTSGRNIELC